MRKLFCTVIAVLVLVSVATAAQAATELYFEEADMTVTVPDGYDLFTRDMDPNDPLFATYGMSYGDWQSFYSSSGAYLDAFSMSDGTELLVTIAENAIADMSALDDSVLEAMIDPMKNLYSSMGIDIQAWEIYRVGSMKYLRLSLYAASQNRYSVQYYTLKDNKAINMTIHAFYAQVSEAQKARMESMVNNVRFGGEPAQQAPQETAEAFTYTDPEAKVSFTVPENWPQEDLSKDREFIDAKFCSTERSGMVMIYGSVDAWSMLSDAEKEGYTREEVDMDFFDADIMAAMAGVSADNVEMVHYGGTEYYKMGGQQAGEAYGVELEVTMTYLVYAQDGWLYMFQFSGDDANPYYGDFEALVSSVEYPPNASAREPEPTETEPTESKIEASAPTEIEDLDAKGDKDASKEQKKGPDMLLIGVAAGLVVVLVVVLLLTKRKPKQAAPTPVQNTYPPVPNQEQYQEQQQVQYYQQPQCQQPQYQQPQYQQPQYQQPLYQAPVQPQAPQQTLCPYCGAIVPQGSPVCTNCNSWLQNQ